MALASGSRSTIRVTQPRRPPASSPDRPEAVASGCTSSPAWRTGGAPNSQTDASSGPSWRTPDGLVEPPSRLSDGPVSRPAFSGNQTQQPKVQSHDRKETSMTGEPDPTSPAIHEDADDPSDIGIGSDVKSGHNPGSPTDEES